MLAEFASVVDAMRCTVEDQRSMAERNSEVPREKRIGVRLRIHQGDIWLDGYARDASVAAFTRQPFVPDHSADRGDATVLLTEDDHRPNGDRLDSISIGNLI
jgi:hypothetical protein